jgi:hypothetical protein
VFLGRKEEKKRKKKKKKDLQEQGQWTFPSSKYSSPSTCWHHKLPLPTKSHGTLSEGRKEEKTKEEEKNLG